MKVNDILNPLFLIEKKRMGGEGKRLVILFSERLKTAIFVFQRRNSVGHGVKYIK